MTGQSRTGAAQSSDDPGDAAGPLQDGPTHVAETVRAPKLPNPEHQTLTITQGHGRIFLQCLSFSSHPVSSHLVSSYFIAL